jgi:hypothetical protein
VAQIACTDAAGAAHVMVRGIESRPVTAHRPWSPQRIQHSRMSPVRHTGARVAAARAATTAPGVNLPRVIPTGNLRPKLRAPLDFPAIRTATARTSRSRMR